jgi:predicted transcriptional regulator
MNKENNQTLKGRKCYEHLGGKLGALIFQRLIALEWIKLEDGKSTVYEVTEKGCEELAKLGINQDQQFE